jgi:hypothetical protein
MMVAIPFQNHNRVWNPESDIMRIVQGREGSGLDWATFNNNSTLIWFCWVWETNSLSPLEEGKHESEVIWRAGDQTLLWKAKLTRNDQNVIQDYIHSSLGRRRATQLSLLIFEIFGHWTPREWRSFYDIPNQITVFFWTFCPRSCHVIILAVNVLLSKLNVLQA